MQSGLSGVRTEYTVTIQSFVFCMEKQENLRTVCVVEQMRGPSVVVQY